MGACPILPCPIAAANQPAHPLRSIHAPRSRAPPLLPRAPAARLPEAPSRSARPHLVPPTTSLELDPATVCRQYQRPEASTRVDCASAAPRQTASLLNHAAPRHSSTTTGGTSSLEHQLPSRQSPATRRRPDHQRPCLPSPFPLFLPPAPLTSRPLPFLCNRSSSPTRSAPPSSTTQPPPRPCLAVRRAGSRRRRPQDNSSNHGRPSMEMSRAAQVTCDLGSPLLRPRRPCALRSRRRHAPFVAVAPPLQLRRRSAPGPAEGHRILALPRRCLLPASLASHAAAAALFYQRRGSESHRAR